MSLMFYICVCTLCAEYWECVTSAVNPTVQGSVGDTLAPETQTSSLWLVIALGAIICLALVLAAVLVFHLRKRMRKKKSRYQRYARESEEGHALTGQLCTNASHHKAVISEQETNIDEVNYDLRLDDSAEQQQIPTVSGNTSPNSMLGNPVTQDTQPHMSYSGQYTVPCVDIVQIFVDYKW